MELLSSTTVDALQVFGESDAMSDKAFDVLLKNAVSCALDSSTLRDVLSDPSTANMDLSLLKQTYPALMTLFIEAAKTDTSTEQLNMLLEDCNFSKKRKDSTLEIYKSNKQKLRANLALFGQGPPHVVDVDWRLDYNLKNSQLNKVMELQYTVALKTEQQCPDNEKDVQFSCTREQLQDFVGKLKEAVKAVKRASQN